MSSTDMVIKSDSQEKPAKKLVKQEPSTQPGVLVIPVHSNTTLSSTTTKESANVMVIPSLDIKGTRLAILGNWRGYTPAKIVAIFRTHYENMRSLAVMLSRIKKDLKGLEDPPPEEYLSKIALGKKEYNAIRKLNNDVRKRGAMSVHVVANSDAIVLQAMQLYNQLRPKPSVLCPPRCHGTSPHRNRKNGEILHKTEQ